MIGVFTLNTSGRRIEVEFNDWRGTPIEIGSRVIYPTAGYGHSIHVQEAEVVDLSPDNNHWVQSAAYYDLKMMDEGFNQDYYDLMLRYLSMAYKVKIRMIANNSHDQVKNAKPKLVQKNERLTVLV